MIQNIKALLAGSPCPREEKAIEKHREEDWVPDINDFQKRVSETIQEAKEQRQLLQQHIDVLDSTANAAGGMLWRKDENGLYLYANRYHCRHFFGLPAECTDMVRGKSDMDLINNYIERTGEWHTFPDTCELTDAHVREVGHRSAYVEVGRIGPSEKLLKIIKTPLFEGDRFVGSVGFALDMTFDCAGVFASIDAGIEKGVVQALSDSAFYIRDPDQCVIDRRTPGRVITWARSMADKFRAERINGLAESHAQA